MAPAVPSTHEGLLFLRGISFRSQCVALRGNINQYEFLILALFAFRVCLCPISMISTRWRRAWIRGLRRRTQWPRRLW